MIKMLKSQLFAAATLGAAMIASSANAGPVVGGKHTPDGTPVVFCSSKFVQFFEGLILPTPDLIDDGCVSGESRAYDPPGTTQDGWDGFYSNTGGGDPKSAVELQIALAIGEIWDLELIADLEEDGGTQNGIKTVVSGDEKSVTWESLAGLQIEFVTIKAANSFLLFKIPTGAFGGTFTTQGILTNGGNQPGLSHVRFWVGSQDVPEPAALGLLGVGLLGLAAARRRKA